MIQISPSLLSADFYDLKSDLETISDADLLHFDVMDGTFVPNISFGLAEAQCITRHSKTPLDVHLMITRPQDYLDRFAAAGAEIISFHAESDCGDIGACIDKILSCGKKPGLVINPATPPETVFPYLDKLYLVLVMTVQAGFGGQKCRPECFEKVRAVRTEAERRGLSLRIEVDGGITPENAPLAIASGADILVAGSSVFGAADRNAAIRQMRGE